MTDNQIGFFQQLIVLLWKNWLIKKRYLFVTVVELLTPLVLFVILVGLRVKEPKETIKEHNFQPHPLPSAGMVAIVQEFCPQTNVYDEYGYVKQSHSRIGPYLDDLVVLWNDSNVILNGSDIIETLVRFNQSWSNVTEASRMFDDLLLSQREQNLRLSRLVRNASEFSDYLQDNYNFTDTDSATLLNSSVDLKAVLKSLNNFPVSLPTAQKKRQVNDIIKPFDRFPPASFDVIKNLSTLTSPENDINDYSSIRGLIQEAIFSEPGFFSDNVTDEERVEQLRKLEALETIVFDPAGLNYLLCQSNDSVLTGNENFTTAVNATIERLCEEGNSEATRSLSQQILSQINNTALLEALAQLPDPQEVINSEKTRENLRSALNDFKQIEEFLRYVDLLLKFAELMPNDTCSEMNPPVDASGDEGNSSVKISSTESSYQPRLANQKQKQSLDEIANNMKQKIEYLGYWAILRPIFCGSPQKVRLPGDYKSFVKEAKGKKVSLTTWQKRHMAVLLYIVTSNPKILYAPNTTQIHRVIEKANETFTVVDNVTKALDVWRNVSRHVSQSLDDPKISATLDWLKEVKTVSHTHPFLIESLLAGQDELTAILSSDYAFSSKNELLHKLQVIDNAACTWQELLHTVNLDWFQGFSSEKEMVEYATNHAYKDDVSVFATLVFQVDENGSLPRHVTYKIRQNASFTPDTNAIRLIFWRPDPFGYNYRYYTFGFVWIQDMIERSIIWEQVGRDVVSPGSYIHQMPYPCFTYDAFAMNLEQLMPLAMMLTWIYTIAMVVQHIVYEKEHRLKEVMKIMGLSNSVHWLAWFISIFLQLEVSVTIICVLVKYFYYAIFPYSNFVIIWLYFSTYAASIIMFCFLISVMFTKAKVASACSGIIYFMSYMPYAYMSIKEYMLHQYVSNAEKTAASLLSTTAFGLGTKYFAVYELSGEGVQWHNIAISPFEDDHFSLLQSLFMLIIDIVLYGLFTWYIEAVFPGQYGLPRPWYFPFTLSYWIGHEDAEAEPFNVFRVLERLKKGKNEIYQTLGKAELPEETKSGENPRIEPEPKHLRLGIRIVNLTKVYKGCTQPALNNLSLNFFENQITSFLGHNGAGKTTTMSVLTGLFPPTSGSAYIYDHDIRSEMFNIRRNLGMCPQHNALFGKFTVEEHLWFYGRLKGVSSRTIVDDMKEFLKDVGLYSHRKSKVDSLSGGMKRKLSVAIAFVGGSRTVILDEPTAGVDPYARRAIWDLIIKHKEGRTILLSTHHMDEADLLGDRIAIMSNGKLQCCGSSLFLKNIYGNGYNLTLLKKIADIPPEEDGHQYDPNSPHTDENITSFIRRHVTSATLASSTPNQITYNLPYSAARQGHFRKLFDNLPKNLDHLKVTGFGLTDTSLEEVFLKVDTIKRQMESGNAKLLAKISTGSIPERRMSNPSNQPVYSPTRLSAEPASPILNEYPNAYGTLPSAYKRYLSRNSEGVIGPSSSISSPPIDSALSVEEITFPERKSASSRAESDSITDNDTRWRQELIDFKSVSFRRTTGLSYHMRMLQGLLAKRFHYARRTRKAVFYQVMLPGLFVFIAMTIALSLPAASDPPPLVLSSSHYYNITAPKGNFMPFTDQSALYPVSLSISTAQDAGCGRLIDSFALPSGIGATCVLEKSNGSLIYRTFEKDETLRYHDPDCRYSFTREKLVPVHPSIEKSSHVGNESRLRTASGRPPCACTAEKNTYECTGRFGHYPVALTAVSGEHLINVTGKSSFMPYLMYTTNEYRLHRYGALSFNEVRDYVNRSFPGWPSPLRKVAVRDTAQIFFNHKGFHSMPIFINVLNNALLRANLPESKGDPATYGITLINHPLNKTAGSPSLDLVVSSTDVVIAILVIIAMSFVPASFLVFLVNEKKSKAKHLQFISGTGPVTYWLSNYIWDMLNYFFPAFLCVFILQLFDLPAYTRGNNFYAVIALFFLYGWSMTPMMYPVSFLFDVPSTAYVCMIVVNLFFGITTVIATYMISVFRDNAKLQVLNDHLQVVFLIFPNYNLGKGLMDLSFYEYLNDYLRKIGHPVIYHDPFERNMITRQLVAMAIEGVAGFVITLLFEVRFCKRMGKSRSVCVPTYFDEEPDEDEDVAMERRRVNELKGLKRPEDVIVVDDISKVFWKNLKATRVVKGLSFSVRRGECFGLLGVNGAGKTTTFQTITGTTSVSGGNIRIAGHVINGGRALERQLAQQATGYCPQFDALFNELTPTEHLYLFSRLRGVPGELEEQVVDCAIQQLDLTDHKDKPVRALSGGNRRKLSVAVALVGDPSVVLLDEPTAGMDPGARRFLWRLIMEVTRSGRAVLLTSHSMEECEILCDRMAIMVNGKFKCFGPTQHLKNKYGNGYMVTVRSTEPNLFVNAFRKEFPNAILKEQHYHKAAFHLTFSDSSVIPLGSVFRMLEDRKEELKIEDYSVSQMTLDDVFISFARKQGIDVEADDNLTFTWFRTMTNDVLSGLSRGLHAAFSLVASIVPNSKRNTSQNAYCSLKPSAFASTLDHESTVPGKPLHNLGQESVAGS